MKLSLNWLKEYVDIPKNITPEKLGALLTLHSVEVEEVVNQAEAFENIVVGKILEIKKHPNADKLKLVMVEIGEVQPVQVVCGGTNLEENMLVAFAKIGSRVRWHGQGDLIVLEKAKIRGEESSGMICAACEVGLGQYKEGDSTVMNLNEMKNLKAGMPLAKAFGLDDVVIDIDNKTITHRPDLWSHFGMAREISAILKLKTKNEKRKTVIEKSKQNTKLEVKVENNKLCPRYMGVVVDGVRIEPSPVWMQERLKAIGVRPINNIVDITNFVMMELGQPLHAFDYAKIVMPAGVGPLAKGSDPLVEIVVRTAKDGEEITTLDNVQRKLDLSMLVIADTQKPIAIAGVIGGLNSEIDDKTTRIVLESANFEPINNRQTATKLGLRTEAVMRYEKSLDPNLVETAMNRALELIMQIIPEAQVSSKIVDQKKFSLNQKPIELSTKYVQKKIGVMVDSTEIKNILERLGFEVSAKKEVKTGDVIFKVITPTWRATKDVSMADDLVEEVARMYGFDNIKPTMPLVPMEAPEVNLARKFERQLKNILASLGFDEVYNYGFVGEELVKKTGGDIESHIKLLNSLSADYTLLRTSLLEHLANNIKDNLRYFDDFKIFEIGLVFNKDEGEYLAHPVKKNKLPKQEKIIGGAVVGKASDLSQTFLQAKEAVENLLIKTNITNYQILPAESGAGAQILVDGKAIGQIFILDKKIQDNFDINSNINCAIFEMSFDKLLALPKTEIRYQKLNKLPEVKIDLAILTDKNILWYNIESEIKKIAGGVLRQVELFDVYEGKNLTAGKKSLAMHLSFGEEERTMEMAEVELLRDKVVKGLGERFGVEIR